MEKYCNNCGNYGHVYKTCRHPILSYGILLYYYDQGKIPKIIMVERKDSLSYIEFLRGKYKSVYNYDYIKLLLSRKTIKERECLKTKEFDELWKCLWIHTDSVNQRIQKEYSKSKQNFNTLQKGVNINKNQYSIESIISEIDKVYTFNEWEIPKGRRKGYENNKDCAMREFREETNINNSQYKLINNIIPMIEGYKGINNVRYKHVYYIGRINDYCELEVNMENKDQYTEIKDIRWLNEEECYSKIRDYDLHKKSVIEKFFNFLKVYSIHAEIK